MSATCLPPRPQVLILVACVLPLASCQSDYDYVSECPEENGYFADALQCDRYYECRDGEVTQRKIETSVLNVLSNRCRNISVRMVWCLMKQARPMPSVDFHSALTAQVESCRM